MRETLRRILPPGFVPDDREFERALRIARTGVIASEWMLDSPVLDALAIVAAEPNDENVAAARRAWRLSAATS